MPTGPIPALHAFHRLRRLVARVLTHALTLGLTLGLATALVLTGCSSAVQEARSGGGAKVTDDQTLRLGIATDLQPATPFSNASDGDNVLNGLVYDTLVDVPTDSVEPKPSLATSWKLAPDGTSITLQLRKGVRFSTGRPLTPADVAFSIKTWADPAWAVQYQRTAAAVTTFDTSTPGRITLGFAHPLSNVFDLLDNVPIIDKDTFAGLKTGKKYVGTGPFTLTRWVPGSSLSFARNDRYWGDRPHLAGVETRIISDPQSLVSQLRSGQLDAVIGGSNRDLESLRKGRQLDVTPFTGAEQNVYVGATLRNPALTDVRLRRAISYAVDRERVSRDVFRGVGYPVNLPWPRYSPAYDADQNRTYDRDLAKAKQLAAAATKGSPAPVVPLEYDASNGNLEATAQIVQADLARIGVKVRLEPVDHNQFIKELIGASFKGLWITVHSYAQWTPSTLAVTAYPFNAAHNASHFTSAAYSADAEAAWEAPDGTGPEARAQYARLNQDLLENQFLIELAITYTQLASSPRLHGVSWSKRQEIHLAKAWLAKG